MIEPISGFHEDPTKRESESTIDPLKRVSNGWYYRYGTPEDISFLMDTMNDETTEHCYSAAHAVLSIEATYGLDLDPQAIDHIEKFNTEYVREISSKEDFTNHIPHFLRACYMGSPPPTDASNLIMEKYQPIETTTAEMEYQIIEYIAKSGKPIEGLCAEYLLQHGARGLLHGFAHAWMYNDGDCDTLDPVLKEATRIHLHKQIPSYYTEDFELVVSTAMGLGVDIPDFMVPYLEEHPDICLQNIDSFSRHFRDLEGAVMSYPHNAVQDIFEKGIEAFPPSLQPIYRKLITERQIKSRHLAYSFPVIGKAIQEGVPIHTDVWDLMQLSDGEDLFANIKKRFERFNTTPIDQLQEALDREDRMPLDMDLEAAQVIQRELIALDNLFDSIPEHILRKALDAPIDIPNYLQRYMDEDRKLIKRCSLYLRKKLGVSDTDYQSREDQQLLALVDDELKPGAVTEFLKAVCRKNAQYIIHTDDGSLQVTPEGIDYYLFQLSEYPGEEDPIDIQNTGLLPDSILPARKFALLYPKNHGKRILRDLGIITIQSDHPTMTIDEDTFGRYISDSSDGYALTIQGLREWVAKEKAQNPKGFSLSLFIDEGLLSKDHLRELKIDDPDDLGILIQFASDTRSASLKKAVAAHFSTHLCRGLNAPEEDINNFANFLFEWMLKSTRPDEIKTLFDQGKSSFMALDRNVLLRRAKAIMEQPEHIDNLKRYFPQSEVAKLMTIDLTPAIFEEMSTLPTNACNEEIECLQFMILESAGETVYEGAHVWHDTLSQIAQQMFDDDSIMNRPEFWKFLKSKYPLSQVQDIEIPKDRRDLLWEYVADDPNAILRYADFTRENWKELLGKKAFQEFLAALPVISTFDNSPLRRNAFTKSPYDHVIPFISFLVKQCDIKLDPQEFEYMREFIERYGLSQNDTLYRMYRWVRTKKDGEIHPDFPDIETQADIDRVLREIRDQITSSKPLIKMPDSPIKQALFAHELGYTGHTFYKPPFEQICKDFAAQGEGVAIPKGHLSFDIPAQIVTRQREIASENAPQLQSFLDEIALLRAPVSEGGSWTIDSLKLQVGYIFEHMSDDFNSHYPDEAPDETYFNRVDKMKALMEMAQNIQTPDDVVEILTATRFEHQYDKRVNALLRQTAILQFILKNNFGEILPTRGSDILTHDLDNLYKLVVSGAYNHTLAIQEFAARPAQVVTQDWEEKHRKASVMRRMREALQPAVDAIIYALEASRAGDTVVETTALHMIPDRGLVGEMSAYIGHACYSKEYPLLSRYPEMVPYKIVMDTQNGKELIGSFLVFPVKLKEGKKNALLVRALNIPNGSMFEMSSIVENIFDYISSVQEDEGIVIIPGIMGARSEFQFIEAALSPYLTKERETSLAQKFDFNGYDLTDACNIVRG